MSTRVPHPVFTEEMRKTHTILFPNMVDIHFRLLQNVLEQSGYHARLLTNEGSQVSSTGQKYVHNDTCYPALLTIGQMISALESGGYDPDRTALVLPQTGVAAGRPIMCHCCAKPCRMRDIRRCR